LQKIDNSREGEEVVGPCDGQVKMYGGNRKDHFRPKMRARGRAVHGKIMRSLGKT